MTTDGWEQRLADLGQARELREEIARYLADNFGEYPVRSLVPWRTEADALLSGPLAPLLAAQAAVERVEPLVKELEEWSADFVPQGRGARVQYAFARATGLRIRHALDGGTP